MTDPGLATERTVMAWRRTSLSALAVAVLLLHSATRVTQLGALVSVWVAFGTVVAAAALSALAAGRHPARAWIRPLFAAAVTVTALAGAVSVLIEAAHLLRP